MREVMGLRPTPEFEEWLQDQGLADSRGRVLPVDAGTSPLHALTAGGTTA